LDCQWYGPGFDELDNVAKCVKVGVMGAGIRVKRIILEDVNGVCKRTCSSASLLAAERSAQCVGGKDGDGGGGGSSAGSFGGRSSDAWG
jgi:hypothetical protein